MNEFYKCYKIFWKDGKEFVSKENEFQQWDESRWRHKWLEYEPYPILEIKTKDGKLWFDERRRDILVFGHKTIRNQQ